MKNCTKCNRKLKYDLFYTNKGTLDGYGSWCKECDTTHRRNVRRDNKRRLVKHRGGKCERCGYDKSFAALSFHHRDPKQKDFPISRYSNKSFNTLLIEVNKCDLLCANCHMEEHEIQREALLV